MVFRDFTRISLLDMILGIMVLVLASLGLWCSDWTAMASCGAWWWDLGLMAVKIFTLLSRSWVRVLWWPEVGQGDGKVQRGNWVWCLARQGEGCHVLLSGPRHFAYWLGLASWVVVPEWQLTGGRRQAEWRQTGGERLRPTSLPMFRAGDWA